MDRKVSFHPTAKPPPPEKTLDRHLRDDLRLTGNIIRL